MPHVRRSPGLHGPGGPPGPPGVGASSTHRPDDVAHKNPGSQSASTLHPSSPPPATASTQTCSAASHSWPKGQSSVRRQPGPPAPPPPPPASTPPEIGGPPHVHDPTATSAHTKNVVFQVSTGPRCYSPPRDLAPLHPAIDGCKGDRK